MGRYLGVDFGLARMGLALSDETKFLASPLETLQVSSELSESSKSLLNEILRLEKDRGCIIEKIVLGLPLSMSGERGEMAQLVEQFAKLIEAEGKTVVLFDERLTSLQASKLITKKKKKKGQVDQVAAVLLLQSYLDQP